MSSITVVNGGSGYDQTDTLVVSLTGGTTYPGASTFTYRPDLGKLVNGVFQGASINTISLSNNVSYTSTTLQPKYNSTITYSAGSGGNITPVLSGSPSTTTLLTIKMTNKFTKGRMIQ